MSDPRLPARWPQLGLRLFRGAVPGFDGFHPGPNAEAVRALERWAAGEGHWCLVAWGGAGIGKSFLLQAALAAADERGAAVMFLPLREAAAFGPAVLDDLATLEALALDDLDAVAGDRAWNEALFNLYNRLQARGGRLLLSADAAPRALPFVLDDLRSRLASGLVYHLEPLDDEDKRLALVKAAAARGLQMPDAVATYLLRRLPRRWPELVAALERLDQASLSAGRALSVPFVREVLDLQD